MQKISYEIDQESLDRKGTPPKVAQKIPQKNGADTERILFLLLMVTGCGLIGSDGGPPGFGAGMVSALVFLWWFGFFDNA